METILNIRFKTASDHEKFLSWLTAFERENKFHANGRVHFVRVKGIYCIWHLAPEHLRDAILYGAMAFNWVHCAES